MALETVTSDVDTAVVAAALSHAAGDSLIRLVSCGFTYIKPSTTAANRLRALQVIS